MSSTTTARAAAVLRPLRTVARLLLWLLIAAGALLLVAWLILHQAILPHIEQWRSPIEARASQALGVPVRIGGIAVRTDGWLADVELRDVALLDATQKPALQLPRVLATISARTLLSLHMIFEQLRIESPQLELRRDRAGRVFLAELDITAANDGRVLDWFLRQRDVGVSGGTLRWTDEARAVAPLSFGDVQFRARNGLVDHEVQLEATPDASLGARFSVGGRFTQPLFARAGEWQRWSGQATISLPRSDLRELRRRVELPLELSEGEGALTAVVDVDRGRPTAAAVDVALRGVGLRLARNVLPLRLRQVDGKLLVRRDTDGGTLAVQGLNLVTAEGQRWPQGDLSLAWRQREGEAARGGEFTAQRLDLALLAQLATRVPVGDALRRWLAELQPQGTVSGLAARWEGPLDAPTRYGVQAQVSGLALAARPAAEPSGIGRPGLRNASVKFDATETGGDARLVLDGGALELPGVFHDAVVPFTHFGARLQWTVDAARAAGGAPRIGVKVRDLRFANADGEGELDASWTTGTGAQRLPGLLELDGRLTRGSATRVARYLPLGIPADARDYVEHAVQDGRITAARFRVKGALHDFPFQAQGGDGEFRIAANVEDARLAYVPSTPATATAPAFTSTWPALTALRGELVIDRSRLEIHDASARVDGVQWSGIHGHIADLDRQPLLVIDGKAHGPLADMLAYVERSPVGAWLDGALAEARGSDAADLQLALQVPIDTPEDTRVKGSVVLHGNDLRLHADRPLLARATGRIDFNDQGFAIVGGKARLLGGESTVEGGQQGDGPLSLAVQGVVSAEGLRAATELGGVARLAGVLSGEAAYKMTLSVQHGRPELLLTSNLVGLAADLPAPLRKSAEAAWPLRVQVAAQPGAAPGAPASRDTLQLELGNVLRAHFLRDLTGETPRVLSGGIGLLEAAPTPASGVAAHLNLPNLNTEAWDAVTRRLGGGGGEAGAPGDYLPDTIALHVQELVAGPRRLTRFVAGVALEQGLWRGNVDADQLGGYVEFRPSTRNAAGGTAPGRVYARLARLSIPKSDVEQVENLLDQQPASIPALDIVVDDFELRGKRLGRLDIVATNVAGSGDAPREWRLSKFNLTMPEAQLAASGHWAALPGGAGAPAAARRRAVMDFQLRLADGGALLDRVGYPKVVRGAKGQISGQVSWLGSPLTLDYPSMTGQLNVALDGGQFLKVDPGAARLLGVLSMQSLPRRFALDFRDVFDDGFAFDGIGGDVRIVQGVAQTANLRMRGVQAGVLMEGSADIGRETQDLRVVVMPEVNAGAASILYAIVNPTVALGTFLAQLILRKPMSAAGMREYHISGSWADPKVERVEARSPEAAAEDRELAAPTEEAPKSVSGNP
jgi:uncharacterized protein (TIGR02099 family)